MAGTSIRKLAVETIARGSNVREATTATASLTTGTTDTLARTTRSRIHSQP